MVTIRATEDAAARGLTARRLERSLAQAVASAGPAMGPPVRSVSMR